MKKNYRLGIDLGSTSLGWCALELDADGKEHGVIDMGVRIFPDGRDAKSKEPLSVARRGYRGTRRNLDRYLQRVRSLLEYLRDAALLPAGEDDASALFSLNPYQLRAKGLDEPLSPGEFSRALMHIAKRRGFRSNRKVLTDKQNAYSEAIANLKTQLAETNARTLGEYLWKRISGIAPGDQHLAKPIKFRYDKKSTEGELIFPTRDMVEHEFDLLWQKQSGFNPIYTDEHGQRIKEIIFYQRPLKPVPKGKCQLIITEERAPKAHPLFQEFRIRQDLNNMKLIDVFTNDVIEISDAQYQQLYAMLSTRREVTFAAMRKEILGKQAADFRFNFETKERNKLLGDITYAVMHSKGKEHLGKYWDSLSSAQQCQVIEIIISDLDDEPAMLEFENLGINRDIAAQLWETHLPDGYCHLSIAAIQRLLPHMRKRSKYNEACALEGFDHSGEYNGEVFTEGDLPYYGELLRRETIPLTRGSGDADADSHGKINNPTVHIALNQLRKLVNALCKRYGVPREIVLELGKDIKLGKAEKEKLEKVMRQNRILNEKIDATLRDLGIDVNRMNRLKLKLWWELSDVEIDRRCVYSGKQISIHDLFSHRIEVDHILPKSRTYDDSTANKILSYAEANRYKQERSPYEAFGESRDGYSWDQIVERAAHLPANKQRRFWKDAMQRYENQDEVLARMLNDTRYMSRVAMKYMYYVCGESKVWTVTGTHTYLLRGKWGLDDALGEKPGKDRTDHRHHAIDAFVISLTTRSMIKHLADTIRVSRDRFVENLGLPYPGFDHLDFVDRVNKIIVSYKPDQMSPARLQKRGQTAGGLLKETAYGFVREDDKDPAFAWYSERVDIHSVTIKDIPKVRAAEHRAALQSLADACGADEKQFKNLVHAWAQKHNVKKLKLEFKAKKRIMIPVFDKQGVPYKYYQSGENLWADIYLKDPTDPKCKWEMEIVTSYAAHQPNYLPQWKKQWPKGKLIMRLFKNDIVAYTNADGLRELRRVKKMDGNRLYLREIKVAYKDDKLEDIGEQFTPRSLMNANACKAGIDIMGRAFDPRRDAVDANPGD